MRFDSLAQQVEHNTFNVGVLGSSPKRITKKSSSCLIKMTAFLFLYAINSVIKRKIVSLYKKKRKDENNNSIF